MTREEINEEKQKEIMKEQNKETIKKTIKLTIKLILIIGIFSAIFFYYTTYISTVKVSIKEERIINKKIPTSFNGLKIIQISDLHYGSTMFNEDLKKIVKQINKRKPDLVVFTGDLISNEYKISNKEQEKLSTELKNINASLGKYAIFGDEDKEEIGVILTQAEFTILKNESELIYNNSNDAILLIGLSSNIKKEQDIDKGYSYFKEETHNADIYTITLLHEPDQVDNILTSYKTDLFLAGHSHNGLIRIPFINKALFKFDGAKKYDQSYYKINDSTLYISSGLGTNKKSSIRLFCRPSINFFRLSNN
ncbi:MAG: metallophosphoesterase [Bacilli bacterium]|nr:metallophosphoesterase [Bacilli bacterium]